MLKQYFELTVMLAKTLLKFKCYAHTKKEVWSWLMDEKKKKGVLKGVMQKVNVLTPNAVPQESRPKKQCLWLPHFTELTDVTFQNCSPKSNVWLPCITMLTNITFQNCSPKSNVWLPCIAMLTNITFQNCSPKNNVWLPCIAKLTDVTLQNCSPKN